MVPSLQFLRRASGLALAAALALSSAALAADTPALTAAERLEDLDLLCQSLERYHPNLFANTPEADFLARKAEIEGRLAGENDVEFALDLLSLTALAGDSHTQASLNAVADQVRFYPTALTWYDGHWYLTMAEAGQAALLGQEVTAVNGRSMEAVLEAFSTLLSADNPVKLRRQYRQSCNVADLYEFVGLVPEGGDLELTLADGRTLSVEPVDAAALAGVSLARLSDQITAQPVTAAAEDFYWGTALDRDTYYIQYNTCQEDPELPMETFAAQVQTALDAGDYSRVLLDLRNNGGGSDGVIWPLLAVLRQEMDDGAELVGLIGETTFSSAVINAVELQEMGAVLVGEPASGSVDHFGSVGSFALPNSGVRVGVSTKYIDLGTLLDADAGRGVESLEPDVTVPQTLADDTGRPGHRRGVAAGPPGEAGAAGVSRRPPHPGPVRGAAVRGRRISGGPGGRLLPRPAGHRVVPARRGLGRGRRRHRRHCRGDLCRRPSPHLAGGRRVPGPHGGRAGTGAGGRPHRAPARRPGGGRLGSGRSWSWPGAGACCRRTQVPLPGSPGPRAPPWRMLSGPAVIL